jgi:hypothetical protein
MTTQISQMSPKFQSYYLQTLIPRLEDDISKAKSHIDLVRTVGETNAIRHYEPGDEPIQHPVHGKISPMYSKYICYKKYLPEWESKLQTYQQQLSDLYLSLKK